MQDCYVGDIGDFGKYGLLRALAAHGLRLGVVWYLNPDEAGQTEEGEITGDGSLIKYLREDKARLRECDPCLYDTLQEMVLEDNDRRVAAVRQRGILPDSTTYHESPLSFTHMPGIGQDAKQTRLDHRAHWLETALEVTEGSDVVFLDPDNGLAGKSAGPHTKQGQKFAYMSEVGRWIDRGQSTIVYHHCGRQAGGMDRLASNWASHLRSELNPDWVRTLCFHRQSARFYFILGCGEQAQALNMAVDAFMESPWASHGHFTEK